MNSLRPVDISVKRQLGEFSITWDDGHVSIYPFSLLRYACPCAECRGGHEHMSSEPDPEVFSLPLKEEPSTRIKSVEPIGGYAITIEWEDGHHFGIYNWHYLRSLCPCPICRAYTHTG